jgi:cobyrinic acid a,c-diamide synthase
MIAAPSSGSGKTLVTCGILQALINRGLKTASFKCGPDYIDPMFHSRIIGTRSKNLDAFFVDEDTLRYLFAKGADGCDISVIEGVMGFYDGIAVDSSFASSCDVSLKTRTPVILLLDCRGASLSVIPVVKGFLEFRENRIAGVIFNRMSEKVFKTIAPEIEKMGVKAIGYVPKVDDLVLESRHLGLVLPHEVADLKDKLNRLAGVLETTLDIDKMLEIARNAPDLDAVAPELPMPDGKVRIGLADDEAFCFIYEDNLDILRRMGAEIVRFSPLRDRALPDVDGIILPGGYPELHMEELESNSSMRESVKAALKGGMPCMAECGGFMYLHSGIEDAEGRIRPMCGVIDGNVRDKHKLIRFGYATFSKDGLWVKGHEFHYWDSDDCGSDWIAEKNSGKSYECIHDDGRTVAGFPHFYYYSNPELPLEFIRRCLAYSRGR